MPTFEPDSHDHSENSTRTIEQHHSHYSTLENRDVVPNATHYVHQPTGNFRARGSSSTINIGQLYLDEEQIVDSFGLAIKQRLITDYEYLSMDAQQIIFHDDRIRKDSQQYSRTQKLFIEYAKRFHFNPFVAQPIHLVNYQAHGHKQHKWSVNTCLQYKNTILNLLYNNDRQECVSHTAYIEFFKALHDSTILSKNFPDIDLLPALEYIRSIGSNLDMSLLLLTRKLCFLLGIYLWIYGCWII